MASCDLGGASSARHSRIGAAVPWRARSPTAPERVDRISAHTASASPGVPSLAFQAILSSYDHLAA
jgi:hypothetical protein